ncbi:RNA-dependent RNA polymerase [Verticillium albo-atrum partitivirus-1]|nr:RNA-dependent RNA polymerase [Verticillium albo-atrum partitivirus-1]
MSDDIEIFDLLASPGEQPGSDETFASYGTPSSRTARRHVQAGEYFIGTGLEEIARYGGYSSHRASGNTDPWVRETLKLYDPERYESIYGFTRTGEGLLGAYKSLFKFDGPVARGTRLSTRQRSAMKKAIADARTAFKLPVKHEPLDWHEVGQFVNQSTSAGVSFPGKKKSEVMEEIYTAARWLGHRMKEGGKESFNPTKVRFPPALAGTRGHMSPKDDPKTRLVWVYPAEMLVVEGLWAPVMYRQYQSLSDGPLLLGKSAQRIYTEWCVNKKQGEVLHGLDFSGFDNGVPPWIIHVAFDILHANVDWLNWRGKPTSKRSRQKWRNVWDGMKWYFINTPILMPDGRMFRKHRGVPSGSWFTQLVDSVVNYILVKYAFNCQELKIHGLKVLGDDSAARSPLKLDLVQAAVDFRPVQMRLNLDKCEITEDATEFKLLGTRYQDGHSTRPDEDWFKMALYPENPPPDIAVSMTRLVGLWLGGAMWSADFCKFFEYFQSSYPCPSEGHFSKDQRRWLEIVFGGSAPRGWTYKESLFWRSIFYVF